MKAPGPFVVALCLIILGLASILWKENLTPRSWEEPYLAEISTALLAGGVLSVLHKAFAEREQLETLRKLFNIHKSLEESGLDGVLADSRRFEFSEFLAKNNQVFIVVNDGQRWIGNNAVALQERFSRQGTVTHIFTVDPNGPAVSAVANKVELSEEELRSKIRNAWTLLATEWRRSQKAGILKIYRLKSFPPHSIFLGDNEAVVTPYKVSSGRGNVPVLTVNNVRRDESFFAFLRKDVDALAAECQEVDQASIVL